MRPISRQIYAGDSGASLSAVLTRNDGTAINLTDASNVKVVVRDPSDLAPIVPDGPVEIVDAESGSVRFDIPAIETPGRYEYVFVVDFPQGQVTFPTDGPLVLRVLPDLAEEREEDDDEEDWEPVFATLREVKRLTGTDVTIDELCQAEAQIELSCGRTVDQLLAADEADEMSDADWRWLRMATAYQAAFIHENTDLSNRVSASGYSQGDVTVQLGEDSGTLSALARRALMRLSWMGSRVIRMQSGSRELNAFYDSIHWRPYGTPPIRRMWGTP